MMREIFSSDMGGIYEKRAHGGLWGEPTHIYKKRKVKNEKNDNEIYVP